MTKRLFSAEDMELMRSRLAAGHYGRWLYSHLIADAEWALRQNVPACPPLGPEKTQRARPIPFGESTYSDEYLLVHESFDELTPAFEGAVTVMCLAYRLTGDARYLAHAEEWVDVYLNEWDGWGPLAHPCDQFAVRVMIGMALYGWLAGEDARFDARETVRAWLERAVALFGGREALSRDELGYIGNHSWFNISMIGLTALYLGDLALADECAARVGNLTDWAIGADGDYLDKPSFIMYAMRYALPFLYGYEKLRGRAKVNWQKARLAAYFTLDFVPKNCWLAPLLRAASVSGDGELEALAERASGPEGKRWFTLSDSAWSCVFYDPGVEPRLPEPTPGLRLYRDSGYAVYGALAAGKGVKISLYAGPHSGKSCFDQGMLNVSYLGEELIGPPITNNNTYISAHRMVAHYSSNLSDLVAHIDGLGQTAGRYPEEWPDNRYTGHAVATALGRICASEVSGNTFRAEADITRAYAAEEYDFSFWGNPTEPPHELAKKRARRVERFTREVELAEGDVLTVRDSITLADGARYPVEIYFPSNGEIEIRSARSASARVGRAAYDVSVSVNQPFSLSVERYFMSERGRRLSIRISPNGGEIVCVSRFALRYYK